MFRIAAAEFWAVPPRAASILFGTNPIRIQPVILRVADIPGCAGINRHVVGNERVLQERRKRIHLGPESCGEHREVLVEA
jgi:hypothetical protein